MQFWYTQQKCNNLVNCLVICPFFIYCSCAFYNKILLESGLFMKLSHVSFSILLFSILFFKPFLFTYFKENRLLNKVDKGNNTIEISVQPISSTTLVLGYKLLRFNCASTSRATYTLISNELKNHGLGDKISLLLDADNNVLRVL